MGNIQEASDSTVALVFAILHSLYVFSSSMSHRVMEKQYQNFSQFDMELPPSQESAEDWETVEAQLTLTAIRNDLEQHGHGWR